MALILLASYSTFILLLLSEAEALYTIGTKKSREKEFIKLS